MSMRLIEEGCESLLSAFTEGEVFEIRDGNVTREMALTVVEIAHVYANEENIQTAERLLPKVADFLIREGDYPR